MYIYAGIDEAGYGPLFGPMVVGRAVLAIPKLDAEATPPQLWQRLSKTVAKDLRSAKGRIVVNDSKKLKTAASGLKHLENGCLAFAGASGADIHDVGAWLDYVGETCHRDADCPAWYAADEDHPWQTLPGARTPGEIAISRGMLASACDRIGIQVAELRAAVVLENKFNDMVAQTHSKAAVSFTFVSQHLQAIWDAHGEHHPTVVIDRQGGRTHYRELIAMAFPEAGLAIEEESDAASVYTLDAGGRSMTLRFMVQAEQAHMPVALASMVAKYTRELMMQRFNAWFTEHIPNLKPTAGYGTDGKRFGQDVRPHLAGLGIDWRQVRRQA